MSVREDAVLVDEEEHQNQYNTIALYGPDGDPSVQNGNSVDSDAINVNIGHPYDGIPAALTEPLRRGSLEVLPLTGDVVDQQRGTRLFFKDGLHRIDYMLVWTAKDAPDQATDFANNRREFRKNLENEGLLLEDDIQAEGRDQQYLKIHAPVDVLKRYAEIMKIRMPMKEMPQEIKAKSLWEKLTKIMKCFLLPFQLDPEQVPELPKKFTCVFQRDKEYLFAIPEQQELFFPHSIRSRIVDYILRRNSYTDQKGNTYSFGISRLMKKGVYTDAYPLHEGGWKGHTKPSIRRLLYQHWARWTNFYKVQPLDYIRTYFGEKIGLYFAWLGFYTTMLIPASILGIIVFIYGLTHMTTNTRSVEACDESMNFIMCPQCDRRCAYWNYALSCGHVSASHLFDNAATVFFAVFMSLWGTVFLEFWKRSQASIQFRWNLMNFEEEEEPPRPEFLIHLMSSKWTKKHPITGVLEPFMPFWRRKVPKYIASATTMLFLIAVAVSIVIGVIVYRISVMSALHMRDEEILYKNASLVTTATAACINLVFIFILNFCYEIVAGKLTDWECQRTQSEYDSSLTIKLYLLQFVNYYSSIFYVAFFKGRFTGRPGAYNTFFNARQEECEAGGCLIELAIQLAIIFVGKQLIQNNIMEIFIPRIRKLIMERCFVKSEEDMKNRSAWEKDYILTPPGQRQLFYEYLEMLLQFGFVTIFVAAFPLAPAFALLNNVIEIRGDANKFVTQLRRPMAARAANIGIWYDILAVISKLSVITNAMIIAFTSGFVHRFVYKHSYSPDGSLSGFTNNSLSYFNVSDFEPDKVYRDPDNLYTNLTTCRFLGFHEPPWADNKYEFTAEYWHVVAAQFIFIFVFENFVFFSTGMIAYFIPDMPQALKEWIRRETYLTNQIVLKMELQIAHDGGEDAHLEDEVMRAIRRRARFQRRSNAGPDSQAADVNENTARELFRITESQI